MPLHRILERQLRKHVGGVEAVSKDWEAFLKTVSDTYEHFDEDRALLERSLEISSRELNEINAKVREEGEKARRQAEEYARLNELMVGRELKMAELKRRLAGLQPERGNGGDAAASSKVSER